MSKHKVESQEKLKVDFLSSHNSWTLEIHQLDERIKESMGRRYKVESIISLRPLQWIKSLLYWPVQQVSLAGFIIPKNNRRNQILSLCSVLSCFRGPVSPVY